MSGNATQALERIINELKQDVCAYLCEGAPDHGVAWSNETEITARLTVKGDDEIWVFAGSGILIRFVAASDGDMGDVGTVVRALLSGEAIETFGDSARPSTGMAIATGYALESAGFGGGLDPDRGQWSARLGGPFARGRFSAEASI